ncbi:MAG: VCBS repeat-containing protein [Planctomycetota bacterium]
MQYNLSPSAIGRRLWPLAGLVLATPALAQNVNWLEFVEDNTRMISDPSVGLNDSEEKDYAWADLDQDGWTDLVCVRKEPFTNPGRRRNVLFMNEGGVLVDRSAEYASFSDVVGDQGFLTPTNDRDVAIIDVNGDGWLDVVTSTTLSPGQPGTSPTRGSTSTLAWWAACGRASTTKKPVPPDWGTYPNMCGLGVGDVTGDGFPELYFSHYQQQALVDLNDRLLINDGTGYFTDESSLRMTDAMRGSSFGTAATIADINGDGFNDVLTVSGLGSTNGNSRVAACYNNPNNEGFFNLLQEPYVGAPYHSVPGDLNQDGMLDLIVSDDGADRYLLNQGNDVFGRPIWSAAYTYGGSDLGFASNNLIRDLDEDGWPEAIFADVDVDIPGCSRRFQIMHNRGGTIGGYVTLREETGSGSYGALGLPQLTATHDFAIFDLDNDGDLDMVVGSCTGTRIFLSKLDDFGTLYCDPAPINSTLDYGKISASGTHLVANNDFGLVAQDLPLNQFGYFLVGSAQGFVFQPGAARASSASAAESAA